MVCGPPTSASLSYIINVFLCARKRGFAVAMYWYLYVEKVVCGTLTHILPALQSLNIEKVVCGPLMHRAPSVNVMSYIINRVFCMLKTTWFSTLTHLTSCLTANLSVCRMSLLHVFKKWFAVHLHTISHPCYGYYGEKYGL